MFIYHTINISPKISLNSSNSIFNDKTKSTESNEELKRAKVLLIDSFWTDFLHNHTSFSHFFKMSMFSALLYP